MYILNYNNNMKNKKYYIYMIIAALLLWTVWIMVKLIWDSVHFMVLNFYRVFGWFLFLIIALPLIGTSQLQIWKKDLKTSFWVWLIMAISLSLYTTANLYAPIQNVVLINYSYPILVLILAYFFLKEKITKTKIVTLILAILWLAIINPLQVGEWLIWNIIAIFWAIAYAILITYMRKINKNHNIWIILRFFFFASLILSPSILIRWIWDLHTVRPYIIVLWIISTGLVYLFYNLALEKLEAETWSIIAMIITPIISILLAYIIINESLNIKTIIWWAILISAWLYLELHNKKLK